MRLGCLCDLFACSFACMDMVVLCFYSRNINAILSVPEMKASGSWTGEWSLLSADLFLHPGHYIVQTAAAQQPLESKYR